MRTKPWPTPSQAHHRRSSLIRSANARATARPLLAPAHNVAACAFGVPPLSHTHTEQVPGYSSVGIQRAFTACARCSSWPPLTSCRCMPQPWFNRLLAINMLPRRPAAMEPSHRMPPSIVLLRWRLSALILGLLLPIAHRSSASSRSDWRCWPRYVEWRSMAQNTPSQRAWAGLPLQVGQHCCWGSAPAKEMILTRFVGSSAFHVSSPTRAPRPTHPVLSLFFPNTP
jgi:hypothetical protein